MWTAVRTSDKGLSSQHRITDRGPGGDNPNDHSGNDPKALTRSVFSRAARKTDGAAKLMFCKVVHRFFVSEALLIEAGDNVPASPGEQSIHIRVFFGSSIRRCE